MELDRDDPAYANGVLPATRAACRFIGLTFTINPRAITPRGAMVDAAKLPEQSSLRVYIRTPLNVVGRGMLVTITKDMLVNDATTILRLGVDISFMAIKHGRIPLKDVFDEWIEDRWNQVYVMAMAQIAKTMCIGEEVATDTLKQRFHSLSQRKYNPVLRKPEYLSVSEFHSKIIGLLSETGEMDAATIAAQVSELDSLFYHGLIDRLKNNRDLARLTQHPPSTNLGENTTYLQTMVNAAKQAEHKINQIVSISMSQNYCRNPVGSNTGAGNEGRTFLTGITAISNSSESPGRTGHMGVGSSAAKGSPKSGASSIEAFAVTMLSHAEKAP